MCEVSGCRCVCVKVGGYRYVCVKVDKGACVKVGGCLCKAHSLHGGCSSECRASAARGTNRRVLQTDKSLYLWHMYIGGLLPSPIPQWAVIPVPILQFLPPDQPGLVLWKPELFTLS